MGSNKLKELFSKIDVDSDMDQRIRNNLLHTGNANREKDIRRTSYRSSEEHFTRHSGNRFNMVRVMASVALSVCVLVLVAVLLYGLKSAMVRFDPWRNSVSSDGMEDVSENQGENIDPEGENPLIDAPSEDDEETDEQSDSNNDETGDTDTGETDESDVIVEQTGDGNEGAGDTTASPEDDNGNTEGVENETGDTEGLLPEDNTGGAEDVNNIPVPVTPANSTTGPFYFAHFDVDANSGMKLSIRYLVIRLKGSVNTINPADLTDVVLTRDGVAVENGVRYNGSYNSFKWGYEEVTDFYFAFAYDNVEPGKYGLTGKYQGESFKVTEKIIERQISDEPAEAGALNNVTWLYRMDADNNVDHVSELVFVFRGHQNKFYTSDLTDLKCFRNGEEIPIGFIYEPNRYYESDGKGSADTSFHLILKNSFTDSGRYKVTGKYRGMSFESTDIVIH